MDTEKVIKVKEAIDKVCREHLSRTSPMKSCSKENCKDCGYNAQFAEDIVKSIE